MSEVEVTEVAEEVEIGHVGTVIQQSEQELAAIAENADVKLELGIGDGDNAVVGSSVIFIRRPFDPVHHGLGTEFRLTNYAEMRENGYKVPPEAMNNILKTVQESSSNILDVNRHETTLYFGMGMDASVKQLRYNNELYLVQTADFSYPMVDDPYMLGKIACANILSDLYALGVVDCDNMLMFLGISSELKKEERDVIVPLMMRGFKDAAKEAGTVVTGGQTVINPWTTIGGTASSICQLPELIIPNNAAAGDVILLTKPMGTQIITTLHQWLDDKVKWTHYELHLNKEDVQKAYDRAVDSMARLNKTAAILMHKYHANCATDISGFGLLAHAQNLARMQKQQVSFVIHNLPVIAKVPYFEKISRDFFASVSQGRTCEVSGGLFICLKREDAAAFCKEIQIVEGYTAWIIGVVEKGDRTAKIIGRPRCIEAPAKETEGQLW